MVVRPVTFAWKAELAISLDRKPQTSQLGTPYAVDGVKYAKPDSELCEFYDPEFWEFQAFLIWGEFAANNVLR